MPDNLPTVQVNPATAEYGISGVSRYGGTSRVYEEFMRELQGPAGMKLLREQTDNCPITGAFLFAAEYLSRGATMHVIANPEAKDKRLAEQVAKRIEQALFDDMETTWPDTLSDILTMLPFGHAVMEMVFKKCQGMEEPRLTPPDAVGGMGFAANEFSPSKFNDGFIGFKKWGLRAQETLFMWEWDENSNPIVMQQMAPPDYRVRRIPLSKCLHFRTKVAKNNPEGRSILRNSVPSYLYRKNIQWVEGVGLERDLAGYPLFQVIEPDPQRGITPPDIWNDKDPAMVGMLATVQKLIKSVRRDEQEGMVLPWWLKFSLVNGGSRRQFDTNAIIARYDQRIAMSVMADFIMLGHEAVGSKALASTKSSLFTTSLNSFLDIVCATINRFAFPLLVKLNGLPQDLTPKLEHGDIENIPLEAIGNYIKALAGSGMPLFPNADLENALLEAGMLPTTGVVETLPGAEADPEAEAARQNASGPVPHVPKPGPYEEKPNLVSTSGKQLGKRLARSKMRRY
jgi:hypothetical protein